MSHVKTLKVRIHNLGNLEKAANRLGLTMVKKDTYNWYGYFVGDAPLPEGYEKEDLGKCEYVLTSGKEDMYEVGVVKSKSGDGSYDLLYDEWAGGRGLEAIIGTGAKRLVQMYSAETIKAQMLTEGYNIKEEETSNGIEITAY